MNCQIVADVAHIIGMSDALSESGFTFLMDLEAPTDEES